MKYKKTTNMSESIDFPDVKHSIGQRVCIGKNKYGTLCYFGTLQFAEGFWCGVELDEPYGKNDGMVNGVRYFTCKENHGIFIPVLEVNIIDNISPDNDLKVSALPTKCFNSLEEASDSNFKVQNCYLDTVSPSNSCSLPKNSPQKCKLNESYTISKEFCVDKLSVIAEETFENIKHSNSVNFCFNSTASVPKCDKFQPMTHLLELASSSLINQESEMHHKDINVDFDSDESLGILPHVLDEETIDDDFFTDLNAEVISSDAVKLSEYLALASDHNADELLTSPIHMSNVSSFTKIDENLIYNVATASTPKHTSTPKHETCYSYVINEDALNILNATCNIPSPLVSNQSPLSKTFNFNAIVDENCVVLPVKCDEPSVIGELHVSQSSLNKTFNFNDKKYSLPLIKCHIEPGLTINLDTNQSTLNKTFSSCDAVSDEKCAIPLVKYYGDPGLTDKLDTAQALNKTFKNLDAISDEMYALPLVKSSDEPGQTDKISMQSCTVDILKTDCNQFTQHLASKESDATHNFHLDEKQGKIFYAGQSILNRTCDIANVSNINVNKNSEHKEDPKIEENTKLNVLNTTLPLPNRNIGKTCVEKKFRMSMNFYDDKSSSEMSQLPVHSSRSKSMIPSDGKTVLKSMIPSIEKTSMLKISSQTKNKTTLKCNKGSLVSFNKPSVQKPSAMNADNPDIGKTCVKKQAKISMNFSDKESSYDMNKIPVCNSKIKTFIPSNKKCVLKFSDQTENKITPKSNKGSLTSFSEKPSLQKPSVVIADNPDIGKTCVKKKSRTSMCFFDKESSSEMCKLPVYSSRSKSMIPSDVKSVLKFSKNGQMKNNITQKSNKVIYASFSNKHSVVNPDNPDIGKTCVKKTPKISMNFSDKESSPEMSRLPECDQFTQHLASNESDATLDFHLDKKQEKSFYEDQSILNRTCDIANIPNIYVNKNSEHEEDSKIDENTAVNVLNTTLPLTNPAIGKTCVKRKPKISINFSHKESSSEMSQLPVYKSKNKSMIPSSGKSVLKSMIPSSGKSVLKISGQTENKITQKSNKGIPTSFKPSLQKSSVVNAVAAKEKCIMRISEKRVLSQKNISSSIPSSGTDNLNQTQNAVPVKSNLMIPRRTGYTSQKNQSRYNLR